MLTKKNYKLYLNSTRIPAKYKIEVWDLVLNGISTSKSVLAAEIHFLKKHFEKTSPFLLPYLNQLIAEKTILRDSL